MSNAIAVIGANFGDEGKGAATDYLCEREDASLVVRFNGGAQAGHTVVTPEGERHVFSHFGSGSFLGVPTYLSKFFLLNPVVFAREQIELDQIGIRNMVYADPEARVTTIVDMLINQAIEDQRAYGRHGSCGLGINETVERCMHPAYDLRFKDLADPDSRLEQIVQNWLPSRMKALGLPEESVKYTDEMHEQFLMDMDNMRNWVIDTDLQSLNLSKVIFEGAQGLLLDQDRKEFFPYLTRSNTGIKNVRHLCAEARIDTLNAYYVSRTYMTRHGAGPFPTEAAGLRYEDATNVYGHYQGPLRYGHLIPAQLHQRCLEDFGVGYKLILTHCDQLEVPSLEADVYFCGPTRNDVFLKIEDLASAKA